MTTNSFLMTAEPHPSAPLAVRSTASRLSLTRPACHDDSVGRARRRGDTRPTARTIGGIDFRQYARTRFDSLLRTAFLITGNEDSARDRAENALAKAALAWPRLRDRPHVEWYVLRAVTGRGWRRLSRERGDDARSDVLMRLSHLQRVILVLRHYEQLSELETARILRLPVPAVRRAEQRALRLAFRDLPARPITSAQALPDLPAQDRRSASDDSGGEPIRQPGGVSGRRLSSCVTGAPAP